MNCSHEQDLLLNRSRASFKSRSSLRSRASCTTDYSSRTSEYVSRPTASRLTFQSHRDSLLTVEGEEVVYEKYKWSKDPSFCSKCADIPKSFIHFLRNLSNAFGWKFVVMVICVYGLQQGLGNAWFFQARDYYLKDNLDLSPAQSQAYHSATYTPWSIKPLYGILSDSILFYGLQRAPYISFAAGIGIVSFAALAAFKLPLIAAAICIFGGNLSVSSPDVMIDAIVAQQCKYFPRFASDLQALCWGSYAFFSVVGFGTSGVLIYVAGPRFVFAVIILTAVAVFLPSCCGFVGERRLKKQLRAAEEKDNNNSANRHSAQIEQEPGLSTQNLEKFTLNAIRESEDESRQNLSIASTIVTTPYASMRGLLHKDSASDDESDEDFLYATRESTMSTVASSRFSSAVGKYRPDLSDKAREKLFISTDLTLYNTHRNIFWLGLWVSFWAIVLAVVVLFIDMWAIRFAALTLIAFVVAISVFIVTNKQHRQLACVALFIFLRQVFTPDIETSIFYWYTEADDGPRFSPIFIGILKMVGYLMMLVGVVIYSRFLTHWPYRRIYISMQILSALVSLIDIVIVSRANTKVGIPDEAMLLSDTTLAPCVLRLIMMPTYVLAAKVCPSGTEATLFAMLMALSNFGNAISKYVGTALVLVFNVSNSNFDNFIWVVVSKSLLMVTPILFVPFLIPDGCPQDDDDEEDDDTIYGSLRQSILGRRSQKQVGGWSEVDQLKTDGSSDNLWTYTETENSNLTDIS